MATNSERWFEVIGGLFGAAVAYFFFGLGVSAAGRFGVLALVVGVPAGVVLGWTLSKLLLVIRRILSE